MIPLNPDIVKAEADYRCSAYRNEAENMRQCQMAQDSRTKREAKINPVRKIVGKLLTRWSKQRADNNQ
ncbi:hypothetical protein [Candidatus Chlorohelix sp.]|uniref:hypothetical protein n=1 Tax=Candidatus Chlorohelix sp. TaxID=3139201 RepID=UPI003071EDCC